MEFKVKKALKYSTGSLQEDPHKEIGSSTEDVSLDVHFPDLSNNDLRFHCGIGTGDEVSRPFFGGFKMISGFRMRQPYLFHISHQTGAHQG